MRKMKVKECTCYRTALKRFLDDKMSQLTVDVEAEVKKVLGLNFLGLQNQFITNESINKILKERSGRFISAFIALNNPVSIAEGDRVILHIPTCPKLKPQADVETEEEEGYQVPINE